MELRDYQTRAIGDLRAHLCAGRRRPLLVSPTGCHAAGQHLLSADGHRVRVEDVQEGDRLMGTDSAPRTVLRLCRGVGEMVRITPTKGASFVVNEDHILTLVRSNDGSPRAGELVDVSVKEWFTWGATAKHVHKLLRTAVVFPPAPPLPIDPYFLGVLLGDGTMRSSVGVSKPDEEIRNCVREQAARYHLSIRFDGVGTSATMYLSRSGPGNENALIHALRLLGLHGTDSATKYVPSCFKTSSRTDRLALLAGLLDTDGHLSRAGYDFISKSERLASDVVFLARSLGLAAYQTPCEKWCQTGGGGLYHRVSISGHTEMVPCRIPRKQAPVRRQRKDVLRTGFSVERAGQAEFFGFVLDGDGRYLLDDFTVTHNSGKTVCASELVRCAVAKGSRVLFLAHRKELIDQTSAKLDAFGVPHGVVMAKHARARPDEPVQVASIQTLVRRLDRRPPADLLIVDEAHHARARTYGAVLELYPDAPVVGLTATPWRADGRGLGELFDSLTVAATPAQLIEQGHLVRFGGFGFETPDLDGVELRGSDYDEEQLDNACRQTSIVGGIVEHWKAHAGGVRTIAFAVSCAHSREIVARFLQAGVPAEHLDGETRQDEREAILARLASGATRVLSNVGVLTEGWDCPSATCCILARPTKSLSLFLQMVGRVLRPFPGKAAALIHDHAGALLEHGLPDEPRDYSLSADLKKERRAAPSVTQCKACFAIFPAGTAACPACGVLVPRAAAAPNGGSGVVETEGRRLAMEELRALRKLGSKEKAAEYLRLLEVARQRGWALGWAAHRYRETFGVWPRFPAGVLESATPAQSPAIDPQLLRELLTTEGKAA